MKRHRPLDKEKYHEKTKERLMKHSKEGDFPKDKKLTKKCRIWTAATKYDYGESSYREVHMGAHRISLMIKLGLETLPKTNSQGEILEARHLCCAIEKEYKYVLVQSVMSVKLVGLLKTLGYVKSEWSEDWIKEI